MPVGPPGSFERWHQQAMSRLSQAQRDDLDRLFHHGIPLERGIAPMVATLWWHGVPTWGSCEGHPRTGFAPWVGLGVDGTPPLEREVGPGRREESLRCAMRVAEALWRFYAQGPAHARNGLHLMFVPGIEEFGLCELVSRGGSALCLHRGIPRINKAEIVAAMQAEMLRFGQFLQDQPRGLTLPALSPVANVEPMNECVVERAAETLKRTGYSVVNWDAGTATPYEYRAPSLEISAFVNGRSEAADPGGGIQETLRMLVAILAPLALIPPPRSFFDFLCQLHVDCVVGERASFFVGPQGRVIGHVLEPEAQTALVHQARRQFECLAQSVARAAPRS